MERQDEDVHCRSLAAYPRCSRFVFYLTQRASLRQSGTPKRFPRLSTRRVGPGRQVDSQAHGCHLATTAKNIRGAAGERSAITVATDFRTEQVRTSGTKAVALFRNSRVTRARPSPAIVRRQSR